MRESGILHHALDEALEERCAERLVAVDHSEHQVGFPALAEDGGPDGLALSGVPEHFRVTGAVGARAERVAARAGERETRQSEDARGPPSSACRDQSRVHHFLIIGKVRVDLLGQSQVFFRLLIPFS